MEETKTDAFSIDELKRATGKLLFANFLFYLFAYFIGLWAYLNDLEPSMNLFQMPEFPILLFGLSSQTLQKGFIWTPITSLFLHADLAHLFGNALFLIIYGFYLEDHKFSDKDIFLIYFVSGLASSLLSLPLLGNSFQLGASGAIFGMLGAILGWARKKKLEEKNRLLAAGIIFLIFSSTSANTNIFAHIFGFLVGFLMGNYSFIGKNAK